MRPRPKPRQHPNMPNRLAQFHVQSALQALGIIRIFGGEPLPWSKVYRRAYVFALPTSEWSQDFVNAVEDMRREHGKKAVGIITLHKGFWPDRSYPHIIATNDPMLAVLIRFAGNAIVLKAPDAATT